MNTLLEQTATQMANSLRDYTIDKEVPVEKIRKLFQSDDVTDINKLDEIFDDNGEGRVDYFSSISMDYARRFTTDHLSDLYDAKREEVELRAMKLF